MRGRALIRERAALAGGLLAAALCLAAPCRGAEGTIGDLCRLHGIRAEGDVARIALAYRDALEAGIPEEELAPFVEDILKHKLDCGQMVKVLSAAADLRREGLPYFVVFSKVREGVAKGAAPAMVVAAAEGKRRTLTSARDVLKSLESSGYRVLDFQNAAVIVGSYLEKGYTPDEVAAQVVRKGIEGAGFAALSGVLEKPMKSEER